MKLSEARQKYIGKTFRVKHADRGLRKPYYIEDVTGKCTDIEAYCYRLPGRELQWCFRWRIDTPCHDKWFLTEEIEPVEEA